MNISKKKQTRLQVSANVFIKIWLNFKENLNDGYLAVVSYLSYEKPEIIWDFQGVYKEPSGMNGGNRRRCSMKKGVLRNFAKLTEKHLRQSLFFNKVVNFIKKEIQAQVFFCEFCEISKNTFSYRTPPVGVSETTKLMRNYEKLKYLTYCTLHKVLTICIVF